MSSKGTPQKHRRWRIVVGDRPDLDRRQWPTTMWGAGLTVVPGDGDRATAPAPGTVVTRMAVAAQSVTWLRHLVDDPISLVKTRRVSVVVDSWVNPHGPWSGRLGALRHLLQHHVHLPRNLGDPITVEVEVRWSVPLRTILTAVLPILVPLRAMPSPVSSDLVAQDVLPGWLGTGSNISAITGPLPPNKDIRAHDTVLTATGEPQPPAEPDLPADGAQAAPTPADLYGVVLAAQRGGAGHGVRPQTVVVDVEHAVVRGRYGPFGPEGGRAELSFAGADGRQWRLTGADGKVLWTGRLDHPRLTEDAQEALAETAVVTAATLPARHPLEEAALLVHLSMGGLLVHVAELPAECAAYLGDEVLRSITAPLPGATAEDLEWEVRQVRQRRAAMRQHAGALVLPRLAAGAFPAISELPTVSALLVTKRLEHVLPAIEAIEKQTYPHLEIVLCMHGVELPAPIRERIARSSRPIEVMILPPEHGFGEAIGVATARARGTLVTKFDDDDTYGPEHVWDLVLARLHSGATMVGKGAEFVHLETLDTTVRRDAGRPEVFAPVVAGGTMLISRGDLEQCGGWRPVPRSIDRGLIDRVRRAGGLVYRTHPLGYVYHRRSDGHTWDPGLEYFLRGGGTQWFGLPRHTEFGTHASREEAKATGT